MNLGLNLLMGMMFGSGTIGALATYMELGINTNFLSTADVPTQLANIAKQGRAWVRESGTGSYSENRGKITPSVGTDVFSVPLGNSSKSKFQDGEYTCRHTGGEILVEASSSVVLDWTSASSATFTLSNDALITVKYRGAVELSSLDIVKTTNLAGYDAGNYWNPEYITYLESLHLPVLRTMNLNDASANTETVWADRTFVSDLMYGLTLPIEVIADLANRLNVDPWWCAPVRAGSDYQQNAAALWATELNTGLTLYLEKGNEVWNYGVPWAAGTNWITYLTAPVSEATVVPAVSGAVFTEVGHGYTTGTILRSYLHNDIRVEGHGIRWNYVYGSEFTVTVIDDDTYTVLYNATDDIEVTTFHTKQIWQHVDGIAADMNGNFVTANEQLWDDFEVGGMPRNRMHYVLASQSGGTGTTTARYAALVDNTRPDSMAIATYYQGSIWSTKTTLDTTVCTPAIYTMQSTNTSVVFSLYLASDTPTFDEIQSGTGAINTQAITGSGSSSTYNAGTQVTGLTDAVDYIGWYVLTDEKGCISSISVPYTQPATATTVITHDTPEKTADRELSDILDMTYRFKQHQDVVGLPIIGYEGGQDYNVSMPSEVQAWLDNVYYPSTAIEDCFNVFLTSIARFNVPLYCHYKEASTGSFSLTPLITSPTLDGRYRAFSAKNGRVAQPTGYITMTDNAPAITSAPVGVNDNFYDFNISATEIGESKLTGAAWRFAGDFNADGKWTIVDGLMSLSVGKTHDWNTPVTLPATVEVRNGDIMARSYQEISLGNVTFADFVALYSYTGRFLAEYASASNFFDITYLKTSTYPYVGIPPLTWLPDLLDGQTIEVKFVSSQWNTDIANMESRVLGYIGATNTQLSLTFIPSMTNSTIPLDSEMVLAQQSYTISYTNSTGATITDLAFSLRYNPLSSTAVDAVIKLGNLYYTVA